MNYKYTFVDDLKIEKWEISTDFTVYGNVEYISGWECYLCFYNRNCKNGESECRTKNIDDPDKICFINTFLKRYDDIINSYTLKDKRKFKNQMDKFKAKLIEYRLMGE